jgi:membrane protease YdiL (CAAX protease family)
MTDVTGNNVEPAASPAVPERKPEPTGWKLAGWAVLWCLLAAVGSGVGGFFAGAVVGFTKPTLPEAHKVLIYAVAGGYGSAIAFFWIAWWRAGISGQGDVRAGLGDVPIARPWLLAVMTVLLLLYATAITLGTMQATPALLRQTIDIPWWLRLLGLPLVVILAPVAEELFFRGWLWTGLRTS